MGKLLTPEELQQRKQTLQTTQPTTGTIPQPTTGMSPLQSILADQVLQGKISSSDIGALQSLGFLPAQATPEERKMQKEKADLQTALTGGMSKSNLLTDLLNQYVDKNVSGIGPKLRTKVASGVSPTGLGSLIAPSRETNTLQAILSDYNTRLFDIAGKAFTGPEKDLLAGLVLDIGDSEERLQDKIAQAQVLMANKAKEQGLTPTKPTEALPRKKKGIGSMAGGVLGGVGGFMAGGPIGAGLGATAGAGAGGATEEMLQDLLGTQKEKPLQQVSSVGGEALGSGLTAWSLASLGKGATSLLGKSAQTRAAEDVLTKLTKTSVPLKPSEIMTQTTERLGVLFKDPAVKKAMVQEAKILSKGPGSVKSGEVLQNLLQRVNRLSKYNTNLTGEQKVVADAYKVYGSVLKDFLTGPRGVLPQAAEPLATVAKNKAFQQAMSRPKDLLMRIAGWTIGGALLSKLIGGKR